MMRTAALDRQRWQHAAQWLLALSINTQQDPGAAAWVYLVVEAGQGQFTAALARSTRDDKSKANGSVKGLLCFVCKHRSSKPGD